MSKLTQDTLVTPNDRFFIRTRCPDKIDYSQPWKIRVHGLVERPVEIAVEAVKRRIVPITDGSVEPSIWPMPVDGTIIFAAWIERVGKVVRFTGIPVGVCNRFARRPNERPFDRSVVDAGPESLTVGIVAGEEVLDQEGIFFGTGDADKVTTQRLRQLFGLRPVFDFRRVLGQLGEHITHLLDNHLREMHERGFPATEQIGVPHRPS